MRELSIHPIGQSVGETSVDRMRYDAALQHGWTVVLAAHLRHRGLGFSPTGLVEAVAEIDRFPLMSVREFISAAAEAGIGLRGSSMSMAEMMATPPPWLCFLKQDRQREARITLTQLITVGRTRAVIAADEFGECVVSVQELQDRWSGIVLFVDYVDDAIATAYAKELAAYEREIEITDQFIAPAHCRALIDYCEEVAFEPSRVSERTQVQSAGIVDRRARNSWTAMLHDRDHPLVADLYARCAARERQPAGLIENIQCVRYRRGQRFRTHFDSSSRHPRRTTFLLYLNDNFEGGDTVFPLLKRRISPRAGRCLRFPSCDASGRMLWPSEHGGLPPKRGIKYALNIWMTWPVVSGETCPKSESNISGS